MAQFTIYKSTDGSAPVLTGQTGKLVDLLDACLVNGYGSKSAAGWAIAYTGTSKRAYRAASGARLYFRIQDDGPGAGTFKEARLTGYETMSDVDTGTGPFPTAAQGVGSVAMWPVRKSAAADATARAWTVIADGRTCYVFVFTGDNASNQLSFGFGEFYSLVTSDAYNGFTCGRSAENNSTITTDKLDIISANMTGTSSFTVARSHAGTGGSVNMNRHTDVAKSGSATVLNGSVPYLNAADGGLYLAPVWICDPATNSVNTLRGRVRGFWCFCHSPVNVTDGDTVSGVGDLSGKTFLFVKTSGSGGVYTIETSATLETN